MIGQSVGHFPWHRFAAFAQRVARIMEKYETRATPTSVERESPNHPTPRTGVLAFVSAQ